MIYTVHNTVEAGKPCKVFVNGNEIEAVTFADTSKGIVRYMPQPIRAKKNGDLIYERTLKGKVTVEFDDDTQNYENTK